jgi:hypothetical protein
MSLGRLTVLASEKSVAAVLAVSNQTFSDSHQSMIAGVVLSSYPRSMPAVVGIRAFAPVFAEVLSPISTPSLHLLNGSQLSPICLVMDIEDAKNLRCEESKASIGQFVTIEMTLPSGVRRSLSGTVREFTARSIVMVAGKQVAPSTAVGVEYGDLFFIGKVLTCEPDTEHVWLLRIESLVSNSYFQF